jgi:hypothetical protein
MHGAKVKIAHLPVLLTLSCMSVCPPVWIYQLGTDWTDFCKLWYWGNLQKSVQKIRFFLSRTKNIGHFTWRPNYVYVVKSKIIYYSCFFLLVIKIRDTANNKNWPALMSIRICTVFERSHTFLSYSLLNARFTCCQVGKSVGKNVSLKDGTLLQSTSFTVLYRSNQEIRLHTTDTAL